MSTLSASRRDIRQRIANGVINTVPVGLLGNRVQEVQSKPESLEVSMRYRLPESVMNALVAGAYFAAIHNALGSRLVQRWSLPKNGRRPRSALEVKP